MPDSEAPSWYYLLTENAARREAARLELERARLELGDILRRGQEAGQSVSEMARLARVSRETAHKLLREARADADALARMEENNA